MSKPTPRSDGSETRRPKNGLEALQESPALRGSVESLDADDSTDHIALIYETRDEQFAAAVPFVRQGIERGERCMYIHDDNSREEVLAALRDGGVDADAALETGQLSLHTVEETYLEGGEFDGDEARALLREALADGVAEYEGFRVTAEETWLRGDGATQEAFANCEAHVNDLLEGEDGTALCQYDRDRLPPSVIDDVVETHPYLIYDGTVCENFYYAPPEEYFGPDRPSRDNDRKLETLVDRTDARASLRAREQYQRGVYEITSRPDLSFEEKLRALFDLGCERFDLEFGGLARVDPDENLFEVEYASDDHEYLVPEARFDLSETYCRTVADARGETANAVPEPVGITDPRERGFEDERCVVDLGAQTYLGTRVPVEGGCDRTFFFLSSDSRDAPITDEERTAHRLMAQWIKYELERRGRERFLRDLYEAIADSRASFDAKIERLLELGAERFDLEIGYFTRTDDGRFEILEAIGPHEAIGAGVEGSLCDTYCEKLLASSDPISVRDAAEAGWTDDRAYERFGLDAYFATTVHVGGDEYGTLCFGSEAKRTEPFSDEERTFLDLMGQWVSYELEQRRRERYLRESYEITSDPTRSFEEKLRALFELGCEQFGLELGAMAEVAPDEDRFEVEYVSDDHEHFEPGLELPLSETYCTAATAHGVGSVDDPVEAGYDDIHVYREFDIRAYLGTYIQVEGDTDRTFFFVSEEPRDGEFSDDERTFQRLLGQWVKYELERRQREAVLRESYEITSDPDRSFDEKLERLLELGCERFDLEMGGLNHLPSWDGPFRLETGVGLPIDPEDELWTDPGDGCFCRRAIESEEPVGVTDVRGTDWEDDEIYREFGLASYVGTKVTSGNAPYGTLWFGSTDPRERPISDAERTFLDLMGQWVSYELERREQNRYQQELYEITADADLSTDGKLERLLELGCERLDLGIGMLTREREDAFEIRTMVGDHPHLCEGTLTPPMTDNYCQRVVEIGESVSVADAGAAGWEGDALYHEFDLECYAGTQTTVGENTHGTVCFTDLSPRRQPFTEAERTFLELMGQCVSYELERAEREDRLRALNTLSREVMDAETAAEVGEYVVDAAEETLDLPMAAIALYDRDEGELRPAAYTDALAGLVETTPVIDGADGVGWEAFVTTDAERVVDPLEGTDVSAHPPVSELAVHPIGRHGVLLAGSSSMDGFGRVDAEFVETVAATVRAALDRVDRERQLQERERTLEEQNRTLERLNRINDTIRSLDQALVEASTREEIERVVCEELAAVGPYELAWIGERDGVTDEVSAREWAGDERGYLDAVTVTADERPEGLGPVGRAIKTGESQIGNDILTDESFEPWRQDALDRGYHAAAALPLTYGDTRYGVLTLYAGRPGVFDDLEREVLTELSDTIAHAINAIKSKKALIADERTELEFTVSDESLEAVKLARELDCSVSLRQVVPRTDGGVRAFFAVRGAPGEEVLAFESDLPVADLRLVSDPDDAPGLYEAILEEESLVSAVFDHGGRLREVHAADGTATVAVELAGDAQVREFVEMFRTKYPDSALEAQRTTDPSRRADPEFAATLLEELTDRQLETLQTAYYSGYFEEPRRRNGSEIADAMGFSQPTFHSHVRTATRKLCRDLFEDDVDD